MKMLKILISAICMIFGQEEHSETSQKLVFQQACKVKMLISAEEIANSPLPVFQPAKAFYTGEEKSFAKENTILSFEKGQFYLADGFWKTLNQTTTEKQELIYLAQKD